MQINCDGIVHNPLGGASYMFEKDIIPYILKQYTKDIIKISVGTQPNSSPHFGTLETIALSFCLARNIMDYDGTKKVIILYEVIETAPGETIIIDNIKYQKSLKFTGKMNKYLNEYKEILEYYKSITWVDYEIRFQEEFNSQPEISNIVKKIINNREYISERLDPKHNKVRIRMSCPICGLTDKNSILNEYVDDKVIFYCPEHGKYELNLNSNTSKLEYNSPYRNLIRGLYYTEVNCNPNYNYQILRVTGSDYAGFYQEEMRYKLASYLGYPVHRLSMIFYAPLVLDWSGAKMSKSLYVKEGAYSDIPKAFVNYVFLKEKYGIEGLNILYKIVSNWFSKPYMLFRHYSIYYFIKEFDEYE